MKKLLLIDGSHLLHRIFHTADTAIDNRLLYGFLRSLISLSRRECGLAKCIVCWDKGESFRREISRDYKPFKKKHLVEDREEQQHMTEYIKARTILHALLIWAGIPSLMLNRFEGDDLLYYARHRVPSDRYTVISEDADLFQLVDEYTSVWRPIQRTEVNLGTFLTEWEYQQDTYVEQFLLRKAILGDDSDGIIKIQGIGAKTADPIVTAIGSSTWEPKTNREKKLLAEGERISTNIQLADISFIVERHSTEIEEADKLLRLPPATFKNRTQVLSIMQGFFLPSEILSGVDDLLSLAPSIKDLNPLPIKHPQRHFDVFWKNGLQFPDPFSGTPRQIN